MLHRLIIVICAVAIVGCGGYDDAPTSPSSSGSSRNSGNTIFIGSGTSSASSAAFGTNPLTIASGTTLTWVNEDSVTHTSTANGNQWSSGNIAPGGSFSFTFSQTGTFPYRCTIHPNMVGTVVVQ